MDNDKLKKSKIADKAITLTDKHVLFWGSFLSNWCPCDIKYYFEDEDKEHYFPTSEHLFMYLKAKCFNDENAKSSLLLTVQPMMAKIIGRSVKNYDDKVWSEKRYEAMLKANYAKYEQNQDLREMLLDPKFDGKSFVEASPEDGIWGIKRMQNDQDADDETKWKGQNLLGKVLDEVREKLKNQ